MRPYLVPAAIVLFGLAVMAAPPFIPPPPDPPAMPDALMTETASLAGSVGIHLLGLSIAIAGILLAHRRRAAGNTSRCERRITTGLASAAITTSTAAATLALLAVASTSTFAISLGEMAEEAGQDLEVVPFFISIAFYILGIVIAGFGLIRLKRHVDHPSQTTIGSGIVALVIGAALIAAPSVINSVGETFGVDSTATLSRPALD